MQRPCEPRTVTQMYKHDTQKNIYGRVLSRANQDLVRAFARVHARRSRFRSSKCNGSLLAHGTYFLGRTRSHSICKSSPQRTRRGRQSHQLRKRFSRVRENVEVRPKRSARRCNRCNESIKNHSHPGHLKCTLGCRENRSCQAWRTLRGLAIELKRNNEVRGSAPVPRCSYYPRIDWRRGGKKTAHTRRR